jgi:anaerobic magnesium-protoporphyrin IX monomethyl ester cyclase
MIGAWAYLKFAGMAAELLKRGIACKILEPAIENLSNEAIIDQIRTSGSLIVCIGVQPSTLPDAYNLIKEIKGQLPGVTIAVEGYHINADPEIIIDLGVAYGFRGDVEFSFADFCESILPGLISYTNYELRANNYAIVKHMDDLPNPAYNLLAIGKYFSASHNKKIMFVNTSRGCPYKCNFCANASQLTYRHYSNGRVMEQLKELVRLHGIQWVEFLDLTFTISKKRTSELCRAIIDENLQLEWACQTRVDLVDEELLRLMYLAGCRKIAFGVESGSEKIRNSAIKPIANIEYLRVFALCKKVGIKTMANFVFGHPGETVADMEETIKFALKLKPFNAVFIRMVPLPDVDVFQTGIKEKQFDKLIWRDYMKGEREHPLYHSPHVTMQQVDKAYRKAFLLFYLSPHTLINYLPLFINPFYLYRVVRFFILMVFGPAKFSYC